MSSIPKDYSNLSPRWRERFEFFDQYGAPGTASYKDGMKALPTKKRILIGMNFIAFFGLIYYFVLGLWKKNLALIGGYLLALIILNVIVFVFDINPERSMRGVVAGLDGLLVWLYIGNANYAYYLKVTQGKQGWNPFEGMKMF